jgi:hypothetical protein
MACCAFAVYLLSQLLWPLRWLRERLFGTSISPVSQAVAWSPNATNAQQRLSGWRWKPALMVLLIAEIAGLGVAASAASQTAARSGQPSVELLEALHKSLCSAIGKEPS